MIARLEKGVYIDIDDISYVGVTRKPSGKIVGGTVVFRGGAVLNIDKPKHAETILHAFEWTYRDSMWEEKPDKPGYFKKLTDGKAAVPISQL